MHRRMSALFLALTLAMAVIVEGQERFGTLTGRVVDQQNAVIPGVTVVTTNTESGEVRTFVTDTEGRFTAPDLVPGRYIVRFELTGFSKVERPDVSVALGRTFEIDAQLRVGELTEVVQVTGEARPLVDHRSTATTTGRSISCRADRSVRRGGASTIVDSTRWSSPA